MYTIEAAFGTLRILGRIITDEFSILAIEDRKRRIRHYPVVFAMACISSSRNAHLLYVGVL